MKNLIVFLFISVAATRFLSAQCPYQTLAGPSVTFRGDGVSVSQSLFNAPESIAAASDGSIYIADTRNNRVRRIFPDGIIRTVAGTGEPAFSGDGGAATKAALNQPAGLAVAADGTLYISDTSNHRVRTVEADGVIRTVAGEGHPRFGGDGGPAIAASLNLPTSLTFDNAGNLFIVDSWNYRVRRVGRDGVISTVAGSQGRDDYYDSPPCCSAPPPTAPGASTALYAPILARAGSGGEIYISDYSALRRLDKDGTLTTLIFYHGLSEQAVSSPTPIASLRINSAIPAPLPDGSLVLLTQTQAIRIVNGVASPLTLPNPTEVKDIAADPSTGGLAVLRSPYRVTIQRLSLAGAATSVYAYSSETDPSKVQSPLDLDLGSPAALAVGPDHTIYIGGGDAASVLTLSPNGQISATPTGFFAPTSLAVDSKGSLYASSGCCSQIFKILPGTPQVAFTATGPVLAIRFDAQDRLYVFQHDTNQPLIRFNTDGAITTLFGNDRLDLFGFTSMETEPMAVAPDGTVYLSFDRLQFSDNFSQIMKVSPGSSPSMLIGPLVPMERRVFPGALALSALSELYLTSYAAAVYKLLADGTFATVIGGDRNGFWGEHGYDSEPELPYATTGDLVFDGQGGLLTIDLPNGRFGPNGSLKRIALDGCKVMPAPSITAVVDSATSNPNLKLAAGQLFTVYGKRLGPAKGIATRFDASGHLPTLVSGTRVTINDVPTPLLYVSASQINAIVPFDLAGQGPARVVVATNGLVSDVYPAKIGNYGPAIFNYPVAALGAPDYYAVMLNSDGTVNSPTHPAKSGTIVTIFATGVGATNPAGDDGARSGLRLKNPVWPVTVQVDQQPAALLYVGTAPTQVEGLAQINVRLPDSAGNNGSWASIRIVMGSGLPGPSPYPNPPADEGVRFYVSP